MGLGDLRRPARHRPLDGGSDVAETARTLRVANFTRAVSFFHFGGDALRDGAFARRLDFLGRHRFGEPEAIADGNGVFRFFQPDALAHVDFGENNVGVVEIDHFTRRGAAEVERADFDRFQILRLDLVFERLQRDGLSGLVAARAVSFRSRYRLRGGSGARRFGRTASGHQSPFVWKRAQTTSKRFFQNGDLFCVEIFAGELLHSVFGFQNGILILFGLVVREAFPESVGQGALECFGLLFW